MVQDVPGSWLAAHEVNYANGKCLTSSQTEMALSPSDVWGSTRGARPAPDGQESFVEMVAGTVVDFFSIRTPLWHPYSSFISTGSYWRYARCGKCWPRQERKPRRRSVIRAFFC